MGCALLNGRRQFITKLLSTHIAVSTGFPVSGWPGRAHHQVRESDGLNLTPQISYRPVVTLRTNISQ